MELLLFRSFLPLSQYSSNASDQGPSSNFLCMTVMQLGFLMNKCCGFSSWRIAITRSIAIISVSTFNGLFLKLSLSLAWRDWISVPSWSLSRSGSPCRIVMKPDLTTGFPSFFPTFWYQFRLLLCYHMTSNTQQSCDNLPLSLWCHYQHTHHVTCALLLFPLHDTLQWSIQTLLLFSHSMTYSLLLHSDH